MLWNNTSSKKTQDKETEFLQHQTNVLKLMVQKIKKGDALSNLVLHQGYYHEVTTSWPKCFKWEHCYSFIYDYLCLVEFFL